MAIEIKDARWSTYYDKQMTPLQAYMQIDFQSLANKFIHSLEELSELFKLQKDLHNAIKKRDKTNFLDELLENYKKQYGNENGM